MQVRLRMPWLSRLRLERIGTLVVTFLLLTSPAPSQDLQRGDVNGDASRDISDPIFILLYLFAGGEAPACLALADADASEEVDVTDATYLLQFLFLAGLPPEELREDEVAACGQAVEFTLATSAFADGEVFPSQFTCEGEDISPPLEWTGTPEGTLSFALTCIDIDSTFGIWIHWIAWDIAGADSNLPEGTPPPVDGTNSWSRTGYGGPCPRRGSGYHRYVFTLFALDVETLSLASSTRLEDLEASMAGHVLGTADVTGIYRRD